MTETFTDPQFQTSVKTTEYTYDEYGNQLTALTYSENSGYAYLSNYMFSEFARQENGLFEPTGRVSGLEESKLP